MSKGQRINRRVWYTEMNGFKFQMASVILAMGERG